MSSSQSDTISLAVLDSLIYGVAKAFDYLGTYGQDMVDKIGDGIIEYCYREGYVEKSNDPQQLSFGLVKFFEKNNYVGHVDFVPNAGVVDITMRNWRFLPLMKKLRRQDCYLLTCPLCMANNAVLRSNSIGMKRISERLDDDGTYSLRFQMVPLAEGTLVPAKPADLHAFNEEPGREEVGLPVFEAVEYGLARGFDYLGKQADLLLENVGKGIIEFLREEAMVQLPEGTSQSLAALSSVYVEGRLADRINFDIATSEASISFSKYRFLPVLRNLLDEGVSRVSCPYVLAARRVLREAGSSTKHLDWKINNQYDATLRMALQKIEDQFDEGKISGLMGT